MKTGIYEIRNTVNGKRYVGSTADAGRRFVEHRYSLRRNAHHCQHLQHAWNKYGERAFEFNFLFECEVVEMIAFEQAAMEHFNAEYNTAPAAGSVLGLKRPPETRAKMSAALRGNSRCLGHRHSAESRAMMSDAQRGNTKAAGFRNALGYKHTPETKAQISASLVGRKMPPRSAEWRARQSLAQTGTTRPPASAETRAKLSAASRGRKRSAESRARMSQAKKGNKSCVGRKYSAETLAKMSASHRAVQARKKLAPAAAQVGH